MGHESVAAVSLVALAVLAIPVACITWTVTHEELLREPREWCAARSKSARGPLYRKFFYVFTCEYCFSHYVTGALLLVTRYRLFFDDWRGYAIAGFALVWIANVYMSLFGRLRLDIKHEGVEIAAEQETHASDGVAVPDGGETAGSGEGRR
jgi:hypothetical protein